jgi:hypothetical protein
MHIMYDVSKISLKNIWTSYREEIKLKIYLEMQNILVKVIFIGYIPRKFIRYL